MHVSPVSHASRLPHSVSRRRVSRTFTLALTLATVSAGVFSSSGVAPASAASVSCPWIGSTAPTYQRVEQVMANMTLADEEDLVYGGAGSYVGNIEAIPALYIPSINLQ